MGFINLRIKTSYGMNAIIYDNSGPAFGGSVRVNTHPNYSGLIVCSFLVSSKPLVKIFRQAQNRSLFVTCFLARLLIPDDLG
jgi:hypothetical protein